MTDFSPSQIAENRAALYHWFARAFFAPPVEGEVIEMRGGKTQLLLKSLAATPGAVTGIEAMCSALASGTPASVASILGAAHARLFYGAGGYESASPYRSVYSSERGLLCQRATAEMERVLRQHRLRPQDDVCEPSDHLSIQLEVMSQLASRFAEAAEQKAGTLSALQAEQADFLANQLLSWLPAFAQRLAEVDDLGFHAGLARVLVAVLDQDQAFLSGA
ncbi:MAG: TorD/DmsD family molecular chaperone [Ramlibacter sp.]